MSEPVKIDYKAPKRVNIPAFFGVLILMLFLLLCFLYWKSSREYAQLRAENNRLKAQIQELQGVQKNLRQQ